MLGHEESFHFSMLSTERSRRYRQKRMEEDRQRLNTRAEELKMELAFGTFAPPPIRPSSHILRINMGQVWTPPTDPAESILGIGDLPSGVVDDGLQFSGVGASGN